MKRLLSLDTGLVTQFTDCGGQYGKTDSSEYFCFKPDYYLVFPFVFRAI